MTRFLAALRRFWYLFTVQAEVVRFLGGRGEVADAPEPYAPPLPRRRTDLDVLVDCEREMRDVPSYERLAGYYLVPSKEDR